MAAGISEQPGTSRRVRRGGGAYRGQRQEENRVETVVRIVGGADRGSRGVTAHTAVRRELMVQRQLNIQINIVRLCAVILTLLFAIVTLRTVDIVVHYKSANSNVTLDKDELQARYDNLTLNFQMMKDTLTQEIKQLAERAERAGRVCDKVECPDRWEPFGCNCYYISTVRKTWVESRESCVKAGGHMWVINSPVEEAFIRSRLGGGEGRTWLGLTKKMDNKTWIWADGTPLQKGQENWGVKTGYVAWNCAEYIHSDGKWSDGLCKSRNDDDTSKKSNNWICEKCRSS